MHWALWSYWSVAYFLWGIFSVHVVRFVVRYLKQAWARGILLLVVEVCLEIGLIESA